MSRAKLKCANNFVAFGLLFKSHLSEYRPHDPCPVGFDRHGSHFIKSDHGCDCLLYVVVLCRWQQWWQFLRLRFSLIPFAFVSPLLQKAFIYSRASSLSFSSLVVSGGLVSRLVSRHSGNRVRYCVYVIVGDAVLPWTVRRTRDGRDLPAEDKNGCA